MSYPPRTFGKKIFKQQRGKFGQQVSKSFKYGFVKDGTVNYLKAPLYKQAETSVGNFIDQNLNVEQNYRLFKSVLRQKIIDGKQRASLYNLNQLADFLPWVFSSQFLFEPFRSLMYCVKQNMDPSNAVMVYSTLPSDLINNVVEEAIYQSVKYQSTFLQVVKDSFRTQQAGYLTRIFAVSAKFFAKNINYLIAVVTKALRATFNGIKAVGSYLTRWATSIANLLVSVRFMSGDFDITKQLQKQGLQTSSTYQLQWGATIFQTINQIFSDLRAYGEIVINFGYLKHCGQTKSINGRVFYYFWDNPNILITCVSSMAAVYTNYNGNLILIPEESFTKDFLRRVVTNDIIKAGGRLFKQLKKETTLTSQQRQPYKQFSQKYLGWKKEKVDNNDNEEGRQYNQLVQKLSSKIDQRYRADKQIENQTFTQAQLKVLVKKSQAQI